MFKIETTDDNSRLGSFETAHGVFPTPAFMPVGTRASVKAVDCERLKQAGADIMLVNTYHLMLRPGSEVVQRLGGIHRFAAWDGTILSDSGGYQIFSLEGIRKISGEGVEFRSYFDGSRHFMTPERSIEIQEQLGVDIAMVLDECPAADLTHEAVAKSLEMTQRWAARSLAARRRNDMKVFTITQGGLFSDLRTRAAEHISELDCDGVAIGGLSVGEPKPRMYEVLDYHVTQLPQEKIRYLMGVGTPQDLVQAVSQGVDLFDCVIPTRAGRFGRAYINGERPFINLKNASFRFDQEPLDSSCGCLACRNYSRAYIHHLFRIDEMLGPQLLSVHNLTHYFDLMRRMREAIKAGTFGELYVAEMRRWVSEDH